MKLETLAIFFIRILGTVFVAVSLWQLLTGLVQSLGEIDPTYFGYFFQKILVGPTVGLAFGGLLLGSGRLLGRWLCRDLDD